MSAGTVPFEQINAIFPGVKLEIGRTTIARMQSGKGQADDLRSEKAPEGLLQTDLFGGVCFKQKIPFRTQEVIIAA